MAWLNKLGPVKLVVKHRGFCVVQTLVQGLVSKSECAVECHFLSV